MTEIDDLVTISADDGDIILVKTDNNDAFHSFVDIYGRANPQKRVVFLAVESLDDVRKADPRALWKLGLLQNNFKFPSDTNTRAEAMWFFIQQTVHFQGKNVIDLGCGTGDFLHRAFEAGAQHVQGVDKDPSRIHVPSIFIGNRMLIAANNVLGGVGKNLSFDLNAAIAEDFRFQPKYEIAFCFSVLPYLDDPHVALKWMHSNFDTLVLEFQYAGDGNGFDFIKDDTDALELIRTNTDYKLEVIGKTPVKEDKFYRTIWLCTK
jgi:SAM-dependent methyltransferase